MPLIYWTPDLSCEVARIDDQHKELFKRADDLAEAMWAGKGKEEVEKTIDFLADYTTFHFGDEERVMTEESYPGYPAQRQAHQRFVEDITSLKNKFHSGEVGSGLAVEVLSKACNWFKDHIRNMDVELGKFLREKGKA
jgi:hemerythrin